MDHWIFATIDNSHRNSFFPKTYVPQTFQQNESFAKSLRDAPAPEGFSNTGVLIIKNLDQSNRRFDLQDPENNDTQDTSY